MSIWQLSIRFLAFTVEKLAYWKNDRLELILAVWRKTLVGLLADSHQHRRDSFKRMTIAPIKGDIFTDDHYQTPIGANLGSFMASSLSY